MKIKVFNYKLICFGVFLLFNVFCLSSAVVASVSTTEDGYASGDAVYVVGNPDAYPVEFFNEYSKSYEGIIPMVLRDVSAETGLDFVYINGSSEDTRISGAKNGQGEIISAVAGDEDELIALLTQKGKVLISDADGNSYILGYSSAASKKMINKVEASLTKITPDQYAAYAVAAAKQVKTQTDAPLNRIFYVVNVMLIIAVTVLIVVIIRMRLRIKSYIRYTGKSDSNFDKELISYEEFTAKYTEVLREETYPLYFLFYFSLDNRQMEQKYGSLFTERFLKFAEDIIKEKCQSDDLLTLSGNAFLVLSPCKNRKTADNRAHEILEALNGGIKRESMALFRAGVFVYSRMTPMNEAVHSARRSYLIAVNQNREYLFSDSNLLPKQDDVMVLVDDIPRAFENGEFRLFLQFIVNAEGQSPVAAEALTRWEHPDLGMLHPETFLEALFDAGKIQHFDLYIFEEVCKCLERWQRKGINLSISCNFSKVSIAGDDFMKFLIPIADKYDFDRENLYLEITEDSIESNRNQALANAKRAREYGFSLTLDDVGLGFSRFSNLSDFHPDILKIDREILNNTDDKNGKKMLQTIINLANNMDMESLCEGVEREDQYKMVIAMGCKYLQGYYYYHPMPVYEVEKIIKAD